MDFRFTEEQERLRQEVRKFLEKELPRDKYPKAENQWQLGFSPEFSHKVGQRGWIGITWPKKYGGQEKTYLDRLIVIEEMLRYGAPVAAHWLTERQIGPSLLAYGTEELRQEFLPRIARGETFFAAGMSEPEAGSDLASVRTHAVEKDDHFVIDGQKVWTSGAHLCHYIYMVVRTDPEAPKHRNISEMIVDLNSPGVTVRPLINIAGEEHFNEVFFDGVKVPKKYLIGEKNRGWYQIVRQLDLERSGPERIMTNYPLLQDMIEYAKKVGVSGEIKYKLAQLEVEFEVGRLLIYRVAWLLSQGKIPNYETAMSKVFGTEFEQRVANLSTQILGLYGQLMPDSRYAPLNGRAALNYLDCVGYTLRAGTSEILRGVVATRGLGLGRE
jgi:alkylation response protein AidB-like acyl-CoA dehydrogenase